MRVILCLFTFVPCYVSFLHALPKRSISSSTLQSISKNIACTSIALGLLLPTPEILYFGNIGEAVTAIAHNPESITCVLDTQEADENHGSCQLLPDVVRIRAGRLLTIKQDWGGSSSTGAAIWNGANMMGWYMENVLGSRAFKNANVLELGAGVGFGSFIANALGAANVLITDGNEDVLKLARKNIEINVPPSQQKRISTKQLRWGTDEDEIPLLRTSWNYILASDVTYKKTAWASLIQTIATLSDSNTITLLAMEPRNIGEVEGVLAEAESQGLQWKEEQLPVDKKKIECNLLCARLFVLTKNPHAVSPYIVSTFLPMFEF